MTNIVRIYLLEYTASFYVEIMVARTEEPWFRAAWDEWPDVIKACLNGILITEELFEVSCMKNLDFNWWKGNGNNREQNKSMNVKIIEEFEGCC